MCHFTASLCPLLSRKLAEKIYSLTSLRRNIFYESGYSKSFEASVTVDNNITRAIGNGLMILVGIEDADNSEDIQWLSSKIVNLRVFNDEHGVMNVSIKDSGGDILLISQFTLHAATKRQTDRLTLRQTNPILPFRCTRK